MMNAGSSDDRSHRVGWARARAILACLVPGLVAWLSVFGCGPSSQGPGGSAPTQEVATPVEHPGRDPLAIEAAIDDSGDVTPGTVELSKAAGSRMQWRNNSADTMLIILKDSHISELVLPHRYSASLRVCIDCANGNYPYVIKRMVTGKPRNPKSGPPGEPQVGVGD